MLGFGDGTLQLHDMRMRRWYNHHACTEWPCTFLMRVSSSILSTTDSYQSAIGDVRCTSEGDVVVLCGQPGYVTTSVSAWPHMNVLTRLLWLQCLCVVVHQGPSDPANEVRLCFATWLFVVRR